MRIERIRKQCANEACGRPFFTYDPRVLCCSHACGVARRVARAANLFGRVTPLTLACRFCGDPITYAGVGQRPAKCDKAACRKAHQRERQAARRPATPEERARWAAGVPESEASIEAKFQAARARRLAEERAQGRRRYTIEDGWQQRSDAAAFTRSDGEGFGW